MLYLTLVLPGDGGPAARGDADPRYRTWLAAPGRAERVEAYRRSLRARGVADVLPMPELLSARRDGRRCGVAPWQLPPESAWPAMVDTLVLLRALRRDGLLAGAQVVSSYRDADLNHCAGGRPGSRHRANAALDLELPRRLSPAERAALCGFWHRRGRGLRMGLGLYAGDRVHLDSGGYRQWSAATPGSAAPCPRPDRS